MNKILLSALFVLVVSAAQGQVLISLIFGDKLNSDKIEFGLDGGLNLSRLNGFESANPLGLFNLGFYFDFKTGEQWYIKTGVQVKSAVGLDNLKESDVAILDPTFVYSDSGSFRQEISYFHIPANIEYRFKNHFYIHGGPVFGFRNKSLLTYEGTRGNKDVVVSTKNGTIFQRLDAGLLGGVGYKLRQGKGMNITVRYFYGLVDILKDESLSIYPSSIYFNVGIPIGRGKKKENVTED